MVDLPLPRRSRALTRELLLTSGVLLADHAVASDSDERLSDWLSHIKLDAVLQAAKKLQVYLADRSTELPDGVARATWLRRHREEILDYDADRYRDIAKTTIYTVFDGEDDYRSQLATRLLDLDRITDGGMMSGIFTEITERFGTSATAFEQLLIALADAEFHRMRTSEATFVKLGASAFASNPRIRELLHQSLERSARNGDGGLVDTYAAMLHAFGRRMRHGVSVDHLFVALSGLVYGFSLHHRVWPESVPDAIEWDHDQRSLFALAVQGVVLHLTEPDPAHAAAAVGASS